MALIALAGLPGVGKTTVARGLAERFGGFLINVDDIEAALVNAEFERSFATGLASYLVAEQVARANLALRPQRGEDETTIIIDAANAASFARDLWSGLAREHRMRLLFVEVICTDLSVHEQRIATRELPPGKQRESLEDVMGAYAESQTWKDEPRWLINTASGVDHEQVFAEISQALLSC